MKLKSEEVFDLLYGPENLLQKHNLSMIEFAARQKKKPSKEDVGTRRHPEYSCVCALKPGQGTLFISV